jgi:hypothetical protein
MIRDKSGMNQEFFVTENYYGKGYIPLRMLIVNFIFSGFSPHKNYTDRATAACRRS